MVLTVLYEVLDLLVLVKNLNGVWVSCTLRKHLETVLCFKPKQVLKEAYKFDLTLISMAPNLSEILPAYFGTVLNKNCAPEVLNERVAEKFMTETVIVFPENARKQIPFLCKFCLQYILLC